MTSITVLRHNFQKMSHALEDTQNNENIDGLIKAYSESRHQIEDTYNGEQKNKPYQIRPVMIKTLADDLSYAIKKQTPEIKRFDKKKLLTTLIKLKKARKAGRLWCLFNYDNYTTYNASLKQMQMIATKYNKGLQTEIEYEQSNEKKRKLKLKEYEADF